MTSASTLRAGVTEAHTVDNSLWTLCVLALQRRIGNSLAKAVQKVSDRSTVSSPQRGGNSAVGKLVKHFSTCGSYFVQKD